MISVCPKCHHEVEHEDYLFEVTCSCQARFNPFMASQNSNAGETPAITPAGNLESEATFTAIREFGESLSYNIRPKDSVVNSTPPAPADSSSVRCWTLGEVASQPIHEVLGVCSAQAPVGNPQAPLAPAVSALCVSAQQLGANAVVGMAWQILSDEKSVVASGTAVILKNRS